MTDMFLMLLYYREEGMGDRGEGMQQMNTGRTQTWVAAFRTEPIRSSLCPVNPLGGPNTYCIFRERPEGLRRIDH